jgi:hypothetical protein
MKEFAWLATCLEAVKKSAGSNSKAEEYADAKDGGTGKASGASRATGGSGVRGRRGW